MNSKLKLQMKTIVAFLALLTALNGQAQEKMSFSLDEAVEYALRNSYTIKNANLDIDASKKKVWETITAGLPNVNVSADYNYNIELPTQRIRASEFDFGEPGQTEQTEPTPEYIELQFGTKYSTSLGINASQLIFDGSYIVGLQAAKVYVDLSKNSKEKTAIEIANAVEQAYYYVLIAQKNKEILEQNLSTNEDLLKQIEAYYEAGFREELDVDQSKLMVSRSQTELIKAERQIKTSKMLLKYLMGFNVDNEITLTENIETKISPLIEKETHSAAFAPEEHIDYRILATQLKANELQLKNEYAAYLPKISAFYNFILSDYGDKVNLFADTLPSYSSQVIGIQASIPIIQFGRMWSRAQQAKIEVLKTENNLADTKENLYTELITAITEFESSIDQYNNDEKNSEIAKKIYDKTKIKYNHGVAGSAELSQNENQYLQAHGSYISSMMSLLNAKINLDKALGKL